MLLQLGHALCLPVPEKTQKQFNFCIIPEYADGITPPPEGTTASEAMVFTIADGPAKAAFSGDGQQVGHGAGETAEGLIRNILNENMPHANVVRPDDKQFVSAMPEAHRKGEKAYHVKAFRGSKEGMSCPYLSSTGGHCNLWFYFAHTFMLIHCVRLSLSTFHRYLVCIQETAPVLFVRYH